MKKIISYKLQFIDCARFMASSLSNLINNIAEGIHKTKCKYDKKCIVIKKVKLLELNTNTARVFLNTQTLKIV